MKLREWVNNNSAVVTLVAVVLLVISLGVIIMNSTGRSYNRIVDMYYYDLNTGRLFIATSDKLPPIESESGPYQGEPAGVRAYVFACGECPSDLDGATIEDLQAKNAFIGYLEKYTPEAKRIVSGEVETPQDDVAYFEAFEEGRLVRPINADRWVPANSEAGFRLTERIAEVCPAGTNPQACYPGR